MTSKQFTQKFLLMIFLFVSLFIVVNVCIDDFGLFFKKEQLRIWTRPKTSKHLFSYKYIPENFSGLLIGSSVSTNIKTKLFSDHKIYNLSMEGANTTELEICALNSLKRGDMKVLIISLSPYITKNCGIKGTEIGPEEYWGSVFSLLPLSINTSKFKSHLLGASRDKFKGSEWGYTDINFGEDVDAFYKEVNEFQINPDIEIVINDNAFKSLQNIITFAKDKDVTVVAYFHPLYDKRFKEYVDCGDWHMYKEKISSLFSSEDFLWDMNVPEYDFLRKEMKYYTSMEHLSQEGADILAGIIRDSLTAFELKN